MCWRVDACGVCNGLGEIYECGCADIPEGDCDCDGNQLDALGSAEVLVRRADADGICDDVDPCVGELDACGVCNGPGEIHECGCGTSLKSGDRDGNVLDECGICGGDGIPAGDATAKENQLDASENAGPREADADADGICDDVDPCVGELDACGVCNGPGAIYECTCATSLKEIATVTATSLTSVASVAVTASLPETATAKATSLTPSASAGLVSRCRR